MKIYMVTGASESWRNSGYMHAVLKAEHPALLVSFVEFTKDPDQKLAVTTMADEYIPPSQRQKEPT